MEGSGSIGRMDYEDMFKEITRKLYGEDPDHRTSSVQNEFEAVSYKNDDNTGNGTDGSCDDGSWIFEEEMFKGTDSRIAAYHPGKAAWRCEECGEILNVILREVADHFMENHSSHVMTDNCRNRHSRVTFKDPQADLVKEEMILFLEKVREKAEREGPKVPSRRTQETQTLPTPLSPVTSNFLLQELPSTSAPQHLQQNATTASSVMQPLNNAGKRYKCEHCNYGTDRRDLFTRHESIHRDDKPFQCEVCKKPFNRADHVKKHHERMHKEQLYDPSKIRVRGKDQDSSQTPQASVSNASNQQQQHISYQADFSGNKGYQLQPSAVASSSGTGTMSMYQAPTMPAPNVMQATANNCNNTVRRVPNSGCNSKSHFKGSSKSTQDRRFTCVYCPWSGADNWCLKRHMQTHTKPFECPCCTYKAARAERRATHVLKVHNKRLCSKCPFITDDQAQYDMHLLQVHQQRVTNTSTSSTLTSQSALPTNVRHQQPIHTVGGRPPPGPPVFPAPTQTIASSPVIPTSNMLDHEMVKSPATAATMAYPTEEGKRLYRRVSDINGNDDVVRDTGNRGKRSCDHGACRVCDSKNDTDDDPKQYSGDHDKRNSKYGDKFNNNFTRSLFRVLMSEREQSSGEVNSHREPVPGSSRSSSQEEKENRQQRNTGRRRRKASIPTQVRWHQDGSRSDNIIPALGYRPNEESTETVLDAKYGNKRSVRIPAEE